jgi:hypothetical protein
MEKVSLEKLLDIGEWDMDGWEAVGPEMARRLRALDEFITTARNRSGIWVSASTINRILDGEEA